MRKTLVVAVREFKAAVRTKSFIVSLVLMPILMGGTVAAQVFFKRQANVQDKTFAVVDRTPGGKLFKELQSAAEKHNDAERKVRETGKPTAPLFQLEKLTPSNDSPAEMDQQRLALSQQVREEKYLGFLDIGPDVCKPPEGKPWVPEEGEGPSAADPRRCLRYQTNHPTYEAFPAWAERQLILAIAREQLGLLGMSSKIEENVQPIRLRREGLTEWNPRTNTIVDPPIIQQVARFVIPAVFVALMFMIVMLASTPAMQGVVEEKMQRIAEVLLGSLRPFELMMGKLLGLMGVSLTVSAVYLGGAYWAADHYDLTDLLPVPLLAWYVVFQNAGCPHVWFLISRDRRRGSRHQGNADAGHAGDPRRVHSHVHLGPGARGSQQPTCRWHLFFSSSDTDVDARAHRHSSGTARVANDAGSRVGARRDDFVRLRCRSDLPRGNPHARQGRQAWSASSVGLPRLAISPDRRASTPSRLPARRDWCW